MTPRGNPDFLTEDVRIASGIGTDHWKARLSRIPTWCKYRKPLRDYIRSMHILERHGQGLFLFGEHGTGKTAVGVIALRNALARRASALFISAQTIVSRLNSPRPLPLPNGAPVEEAIRQVHFLQVDDLGSEDRADWKQPEVEDAIRYRYNNDLPTIITTNLEKKQVQEIKWLVSLMTHKVTPLEITGINWRTKPPPWPD